MSKKSDEFEKQIYRIYKVLESDKDAVITWNDKIKDPDNPKQNRQIDITIKKENLFVVIECRLHKKPQDAKWLEELVGRKLSLNADLIIGVSSSGFTKTAIDKANRFGILLRDTNLLSKQEINSWVTKSIISLGLFFYQDVELYFIVKCKKMLQIEEKL